MSATTPAGRARPGRTRPVPGDPDGLRPTLARHLRTWRAVLVQAIRRDVQFRAQAWTTALVALAQIGVGLVPVLVLGSQAPVIGGWTARQLVAVAGCYQLVQSLLEVFVAPNLLRLSGYVRTGELDGVLIRPVDPQWFTTFRWLQPAALTGTVAGLVLVLVGLGDTRPTVGGVLEALLALACGLLLLTAVWTNFAYLAFWFTSADFVHDLVLEAFAAGRYPVSLFPTAVRTLMIFVVPVGVASTFPVEALVRGPSLLQVLIMVGLCLLAVVITRLHWRVALRRYASASS